jgi:hypothetical protein
LACLALFGLGLLLFIGLFLYGIVALQLLGPPAFYLDFESMMPGSARS